MPAVRRRDPAVRRDSRAFVSAAYTYGSTRDVSLVPHGSGEPATLRLLVALRRGQAAPHVAGGVMARDATTEVVQLGQMKLRRGVALRRGAAIPARGRGAAGSLLHDDVTAPLSND